MVHTCSIPSGKRLHNNGKSPCLMGKLTISMAIFKLAFSMLSGGYHLFHRYFHLFSMGFSSTTPAARSRLALRTFRVQVAEPGDLSAPGVGEPGILGILGFRRKNHPLLDPFIPIEWIGSSGTQILIGIYRFPIGMEWSRWSKSIWNHSELSKVNWIYWNSDFHWNDPLEWWWEFK